MENKSKVVKIVLIIVGILVGAIVGVKLINPESKEAKEFMSEVDMLEEGIIAQITSGEFILNEEGYYIFDFTNKNYNVMILQVKNIEKYTGKIKYIDREFIYEKFGTDKYRIVIDKNGEKKVQTIEKVKKEAKKELKSILKAIEKEIKAQVKNNNVVMQTDDCYLFDFTNKNGNYRQLKITGLEKLEGKIKYCNGKFIYEKLKSEEYVVNTDEKGNKEIITVEEQEKKEKKEFKELIEKIEEKIILEVSRNNVEKAEDNCYIFDFTNKNDNLKNIDIKSIEKLEGKIKYCDGKFIYEEVKMEEYVLTTDEKGEKKVVTQEERKVEKEKEFQTTIKAIEKEIKEQILSSNAEKDEDSCYLYDFDNKNENYDKLDKKLVENLSGKIKYCNGKFIYENLGTEEYKITTNENGLKEETTVKKYIVTYINEGIEYKKEQVKEKEILTKPNNPSKIGYKFKYWSETEEGSEYNFLSKVTKNIKLYAVYEKEENKTKNKYKVTLKEEDGTVIEEKEYEEGSIISEPNRKEKEGYTFKGWYKKESIEKYDILTPITSDIELYSKYEINKYTIIFKDEDGSVLQQEYIEYGKVPQYKGNTPIKKSTAEYTYIFKGWDKQIVIVTEDREYKATYNGVKNKYKITYKNEDGSILQEEAVEYGKIPEYKGEEPNKAKTARYTYTFSGWDKEITKVEKEQIYTARYNNEINKYKITYVDSNEGTETIEYEYGSVVLIGKTIEKEGYTLTGWYTEDETKQEFPLTITEDIILTSKYQLNRYVVSFYHNNNKYVEDQIVNYNELAVKPEIDPEKEDYDFIGWQIKETNNIYNFSEAVKSNIELESVFEHKKEYTVKFMVEKEEIDSIKVVEGKKATRIEDPSKKGYTFDKWYIDEEYTQEYDFEEEVTENKIIYGRYNENKHKVTYINEGEKYKEEEVLDSYTVERPQEIPSKEGYTFKYWKYNEREYNFDTEVTEDITLEAEYEINKYEVVFKNENGIILQREELEYLSIPTYKAEVPTKEKDAEYTYIFKDWNREIEEVKSDQEYTATYTNVKNKYTVTYVDNGEIKSTVEYEYGSVVIEPEEEEKEGYTFIGWYKDGQEEKYTFVEAITEDIALYSKYEKNSYAVAFKDYDGSILQGEILEYGSMPEYKAEIPTRQSDEEYEYEFVGWDKVVTEVRGIQEYIAIYRQIKVKYTLTYIDNEEEIKTDEYEYGSVVVKPENPEKEGYTFIGWYNGEEKEEFPITITKNITLTSKYTINKYTVSFYHNNSKYVEDQIVEYNKMATKPEVDPEKEDYNFAGWQIKGTNNVYNFSDGVTTDIELESKFTQKPVYTITFVLDGAVVNEVEVIKDRKVIKPEDPSKKGYIFDKWYKDNLYTEEYDFEEAIIENKTIYGKYNENKHKVTYMNEGEKYKEEEVLDSYTIEEPLVNPSKEGYTFKYWKLNNEEYNFNTEVTEDITLEAEYEINKYEVVFKNENGEELQKEELEYGSIPEYKGESPSKQATAEYTYTFSTWDKTITAVSSNQEYVAQYTKTKNKYSIIFANSNGEELQKEELEYGSIPEYKNETPTKKATAEYTYTFSGWNKEIEEVTQTDTYIATYTETKNKYNVVFKNESGEVLQSEQVEYGSMPAYKGETPIKEADAQYTYTFNGWNKEIVIVRSNQEYIATYTGETNRYNVVFKNYDGSILQTESLYYGVMPEYKGTTPTKEKDVEYTYTFNNWDKEITEVHASQEYVAQYTKTKNKYAIVFKNEDGSILQNEEVEYGSIPEYKGETPTKSQTTQYTYTFNGWDSTITAVTGVKVYVAEYTPVIRSYEITFKNEDGSVLQRETLNYGVMPEYKGETPSKSQTAQYTYAFKGWDKEITTVGANKEYIATYQETIRSYEITFKNDDGSVLQTENINYGVMPEYKGTTPSKSQTAQYTYTFKGWDSSITTVTGTKEYVAEYTPVVRSYEITFKNEDGSVLQTELLSYGTIPEYKGATPNKAQTAQYTYTFNNWDSTVTAVTGAKEYVAQYTATVRSYQVTFFAKTSDEALLIYSYEMVEYGSKITKPASNPTRENYLFKYWSTEDDGSEYDFDTPVTGVVTLNAVFEYAYICRAATTLHTEICSQTDSTKYCSGNGYNTGDTIEYGNIPYRDMYSTGDAFDCDVNGDGTYDPDTERFYYVSDYYNTSTKEFESDTAVLIYSRDVIGTNVWTGPPYGLDLLADYTIPASNHDGAVQAAYNYLPRIWNNVSLKNSSRVMLTELGGTKIYNGTNLSNANYAYSTRLLTVQELNRACNMTVTDGSQNKINNCDFLFERTVFGLNNSSVSSYYLETPVYSSDEDFWAISSTDKAAFKLIDSANGSLRPVIEVPKTEIYRPIGTGGDFNSYPELPSFN